jgi:hypothetical protein
MRLRHLLGLFAFSVVPATLTAQGGCPALPAGSTVRLFTPAAATYTLPQSVQPSDTVMLVQPFGMGARTIPCARLNHVQLRVGDRPRSQNILRGAGVGLLVGAVAGGALIYFTTEPDDGDGYEILSRRDVTIIGAVLGGGTGTVVGGVAGALAPARRWEEVPFSPHQARAAAEGLRIAPAGGAGVRVSYTLGF